ncbi:glycosyltransferase family 4 protein [Nocardioides sp. CER19]|uniref:glycosyltransferase family 4 protein n=1 Tax=Nocardioides sp. CER19 TaxID=3038538 RepID=UPI00244A0FCA|nr:glycosyltransferase family 4 protein [Nocardioides sp. CER19]MDH2416638.1 glycosyltransferase family 4 protein [Nocardioides sp. CER19]
MNGRHIAMLSWRDVGNPEGGGAEHYLERIATGLVERGAKVTVVTAAYPGAPAEETIDGVRYVRRGGKLTVYLAALLVLLRRRLPGGIGRVDAVVDVQNGLPFFSRLVTRLPVVVLVHHVHREQWPVVYPGRVGRMGWWIESRVAPRLYRHCQYVTVSRASRDELCRLGVDIARIAVVHNGADSAVVDRPERTAHPSICVVGRLVPHKRVELAIDAVAALRSELPELRLTVVGSGWWEDEVKEYAARRGVADAVEFTGFVDEATKADVYERSWVMALPSLKEGWGLVVSEAARFGTPTVAFRSAGGTQESVSDGVSGLLVDEPAEFVEALRLVLTDDVERKELSQGALAHAGEFSWTRSRAAFADVAETTMAGGLTATTD